MGDIFVSPVGTWKRAAFESEAELERAIVEIQRELFGPGRIYLDVKKKIGVAGSVTNIPDGYLLDLTGSRPKLYVVENELAAHDPLRHIAVQILQFSLSFEDSPLRVKNIVMDALAADTAGLATCREYCEANGFRSVDHLVEEVVFRIPFAAVVIIDEMPDRLETILASRFQFGVETLVLSPYENEEGGRAYHFEPFLADVGESVPRVRNAQPDKVEDTSSIDTVVVPAREDGFIETFLGGHTWYAIRIHPSMREQIRYIGRLQGQSHLSHHTYRARRVDRAIQGHREV